MSREKDKLRLGFLGAMTSTRKKKGKRGGRVMYEKPLGRMGDIDEPARSIDTAALTGRCTIEELIKKR